jgi:hypothetical protein
MDLPSLLPFRSERARSTNQHARARKSRRSVCLQASASRHILAGCAVACLWIAHGQITPAIRPMSRLSAYMMTLISMIYRRLRAVNGLSYEEDASTFLLSLAPPQTHQSQASQTWHCAVWMVEYTDRCSHNLGLHRLVTAIALGPEPL